MLKHQGHGIWKSDTIIIKSAKFFLYKYVVLDEGIIKRREKGPNRIADLEVIDDSISTTPLSKRHKSISPNRRINQTRIKK